METVKLCFCLTVLTVHQRISTSSPVFFFKMEVDRGAHTYIAQTGETPVLRCPLRSGDRVNIEVQTASDMLTKIVDNSTLNETYEGRFSIATSKNFFDITVLSPEINGREVRCIGRPSATLHSLKVLFIPFYMEVNEGHLSLQTYCSVDIEFETSSKCVTDISPYRKINDTHCEKSLKVDCSLDEQCYINASIGLSNEQNIITRHLQFGTICTSSMNKEKTTYEMTTLTGTNPEQNVTDTASNGKSQIPPLIWIAVGLLLKLQYHILGL